MNICLEIIKNYKQLSSTISKIQALFEHFFATFSAMFWRIFQRNGNMPTLNRDIFQVIFAVCFPVEDTDKSVSPQRRLGEKC